MISQKFSIFSDSLPRKKLQATRPAFPSSDKPLHFIRLWKFHAPTARTLQLRPQWVKGQNRMEPLREMPLRKKRTLWTALCLINESDDSVHSAPLTFIRQLRCPSLNMQKVEDGRDLSTIASTVFQGHSNPFFARMFRALGRLFVHFTYIQFCRRSTAKQAKKRPESMTLYWHSRRHGHQCVYAIL